MIYQNHLIVLYFVKWRDTGRESIILGDNLRGHFFPLRDSISINFFK